MMRRPVKSVYHKASLTHDFGYTLIEVLIVLSIACIITPISFLAFSHLSDEVTLKHFMSELDEKIHDTQIAAISESDVPRIVFNNPEHFYYVSFKNRIERIQMNPRITIYSGYQENSIMINQLGHFTNIKTFTITLGSIRYRLVLLLGQGRYYYEKTT